MDQQPRFQKLFVLNDARRSFFTLHFRKYCFAIVLLETLLLNVTNNGECLHLFPNCGFVELNPLLFVAWITKFLCLEDSNLRLILCLQMINGPPA
jgi:hypothetical protein